MLKITQISKASSIAIVRIRTILQKYFGRFLGTPLLKQIATSFVGEQNREMWELTAPLVKKYLKVYVAAIVIYAAIYLVPSMSFQTAEEPARLKLIDSFYFSVVTITSLGYGDIVPKSTPIKLVAMTQAIAGLVLVGMFFLELSILIGRRYQEEYERSELARLDRQQFPAYVDVVHRLTQYIDSKASNFLRQAQNYDWTYYYFGEKDMGIPPSFMGKDKFLGLGPSENISPAVEQANKWGKEMQQLLNDLRRLILDSKPIIFDDQILKEYDYIARLLMTASQDLESTRPEESQQDILRKTTRNCKIVSAVIEELRTFRKLFTDKADRAQGGGSYRYKEIHDRLSQSEIPY